MPQDESKGAVHRRRNPLNGRWVLVSPHRAQRPWLGQREEVQQTSLPSHDPDCYLCPGNSRANGVENPQYSGTFVFDNDFPALLETEQPPYPQDPVFTAESVAGISRVICFTPDHNRSLARLSLLEIRGVIDCWAAQSAALGERFSWVQVFENKGAMMGCSSPHPHGQIWASNHLPDEPAAEDRCQRDWLAIHNSVLLQDVVSREADGERVVLQNEHWLAIVPFWAVWPFETLLLPRFPVKRLEQLDDIQRNNLASVLSALSTRYDALFGCEFPYSMGWHGAPYTQSDDAHWQLHAHFYPPLLRSATIRKFMVGYELLAEAQRDLTPEQAAARLRDVQIGSDHASATPPPP